MAIDISTPDRFEAVFGLPPKKQLTEEEKLQAAQTNRLFDLMRLRFNMSEAAIFDVVGMRDRFGTFLNDVLSCPEEVQRYCQETLAPAPSAQAAE